MITIQQYWMGRDKQYPAAFTKAIQSNGVATVFLVNKVIAKFSAETGINLDQLASGWRPAAVNDATSNAASHSTHIIAKGEDVRDTPNRDFARWVCKNKAFLEEIGLWVERFEWTSKLNQKTGEWENWVHLQTVPPLSGHRYYIPSTAPALAKRLPEQDQYGC